MRQNAARGQQSTDVLHFFTATSFVAMIPLSDLKIDGSPKECGSPSLACHPQASVDAHPSPLAYADRDSATHSGNTTSRFFCGDCGTPIHTQGPMREGATVFKMGLFAKQGLKYKSPVVEIFNVNRNDWEKPIEGAGQFDHMPQ